MKLPKADSQALGPLETARRATPAGDIIAWCLCEVARARTTRRRRPQPLNHARRARLARSTMLPDALAARRGRDAHTLNRQKGGMNGARLRVPGGVGLHALPRHRREV